MPIRSLSSILLALVVFCGTVRADPPRRASNRAMIVSGAILTGLSVFFVAYSAGVGISTELSCRADAPPGSCGPDGKDFGFTFSGMFLGIGTGLAAVGIPLLSVGVHRERARLRVAPTSLAFHW